MTRAAKIVSRPVPDRLVVVGGASLDLLHFAGRTARSAGGAGLYTALAAARAGTRVVMVGPRPEPMPPELEEAAERIDWRGPPVAPELLPTFEIAHLPDGHTEMRRARLRAEADLGPADLPDDLAEGELVFLIAMADPRRQLALLEELNSRRCRVACGAYGCAVEQRPEVVRRVLAAADMFFCNEREARGIFGGLGAARTEPGKLLFVTRGPRGATVVQGDTATDLAGLEVRELDPTGAGDTFSGTTVAWLRQGLHPVRAARRGVAAAARTVTRVGPAALLDPPDALPPRPEPRALVDRRALARVARVLGELRELQPFTFVGPTFPPPGHPGALDFFFTATLQQFGFWHAEADGYAGPIIAELGGRDLKGSDYLWTAFLRWLESAPRGLTPSGQSRLEEEELARRLRADDGTVPLPDLGTRLRLATGYGRDLAALGSSPETILARANRSRRPVARLLAELDHVAGYKEDPLRKKSALLALILRQRPEGFLRRTDDDPIPPIVDYHVQRSCLRTGIVRIRDDELRRRLEGRRLVGAEAEWAVRRATYDAMLALVLESGRPMEAVDWFFFGNRKRCPEMAEPDCAVCPLEEACAREKALFQPVHRTTFY